MAKADSTGGASPASLPTDVAPACHLGSAATDALARVTVKPDRYSWRLAEYLGTAEDLIVAGIVRADQFPEKTSATFYRGERRNGKSGTCVDEHYLKVIRCGRKFRACVGLPQEEQERRRAAHEEQLRREDEAEMRERAAKEAAQRANPDNLRSCTRMFAEALRRTLIGHTRGHEEEGSNANYRCRFDPKGIKETLEALEEVAAWIEGATIYPPKRPKPQGLDAARGDKDFQVFMQSQCLKGQ
jgi:hypothetical protein